jgi:hypothetical protein
MLKLNMGVSEVMKDPLKGKSRRGCGAGGDIEHTITRADVELVIKYYSTHGVAVAVAHML